MSKEGKNWFSRHKVLTVILVFIGLIVIVSAASSGGDNANQSASNNTESSDQAENSNTGQMAKVGEPARDGKFEFVVKDVECGRANVGSDFLTETAQGQYCLLNVTVKNIGDEAQSLFSDNQYLFNANGQKYSANSSATYAAAPSGISWYDDINPGNSVEGTIVFDLPKDQTPVTAQLHDSMFSNGVKVSLE